MVDVRFELTTNDPWSVDDAICEGISPLGYWQKVNQSPTQTKHYNIVIRVWSFKPTEGSIPQLLQLQCSPGAKRSWAFGPCAEHTGHGTGQRQASDEGQGRR